MIRFVIIAEVFEMTKLYEKMTKCELVVTVSKNEVSSVYQLKT